MTCDKENQDKLCVVLIYELGGAETIASRDNVTVTLGAEQLNSVSATVLQGFHNKFGVLEELAFSKGAILLQEDNRKTPTFVGMLACNLDTTHSDLTSSGVCEAVVTDFYESRKNVFAAPVLQSYLESRGIEVVSMWNVIGKASTFAIDLVEDMLFSHDITLYRFQVEPDCFGTTPKVATGMTPDKWSSILHTDVTTEVGQTRLPLVAGVEDAVYALNMARGTLPATGSVEQEFSRAILGGYHWVKFPNVEAPSKEAWVMRMGCPEATEAGYKYCMVSEYLYVNVQDMWERIVKWRFS